MLILCILQPAWCSGESCLTESPGRGFEAASPQILRGKGLSRFIPSPDPTHVGASGTGSALYKNIRRHLSRFLEYMFATESVHLGEHMTTINTRVKRIIYLKHCTETKRLSYCCKALLYLYCIIVQNHSCNIRLTVEPDMHEVALDQLLASKRN